MAEQHRQILLQNGVVIIHDERDRASPVQADILIKGNKIERISATIRAEPGMEVLDCKNKIVAPGFIDTHRHMWSTALRGRHGDDLMEDYVSRGRHRTTTYRRDQDKT